MKMPTRAGPSRYADFDGDVRSESEEEPLTQEDIDLVLRKAIHYMITNGGPDSQDTYNHRVNAIEEGLLQEYRNQGYPYDPQLYRQLRSLVREAQSPHPHDTYQSSQEDSALENSEFNMEELSSPEALYRQDDEPDEPDEPDDPPAGLEAPRPAKLSPRLQGPRKAEVIETQYLYGGPNNEVEEWHKDFPAALPFGETLYMQEWESMKIDYDLAESARTLHSDEDHIVHTNVPYNAVAARIDSPSPYESGSRFALPAKIWTMWDRIENKAMSKSALAKRLDEFNQGGGLKEPGHRDYVPRVFLPQVSHEPKSVSRSSSALGMSDV